MSQYVKILLFLIVLLSFQTLIKVFAEKGRLQFNQLTVEDGLAQNTVHSIAQDKYGFMWFGTWNGLCRYDGYQFKTYQFNPDDSTSLSNNRVHLLHKDPSGTLWVATFDTIICRYNYETDDFTRFSASQLPTGLRDSTNRYNAYFYFQTSKEEMTWKVNNNEFWQINNDTKDSLRYTSGIFSPNSLSDDYVQCVYLDNNDVLWVGTSMGGVNKTDLQAKRFNHKHLVLKDDDKLVNAPVRSIWADQNTLWLGSSSSGFVIIDRINEEVNFPSEVERGINTKNVRVIFGDSYGYVWLGFRTGLYRYHVESGKLKQYSDAKIPDYPIYAIAEDLDKNLWIGGFNNIFQYNRQLDSFTTFQLPYEHMSSSIVSLMVDRFNNIWVGTELSGVIKIERHPDTRQWNDTTVYSRAAPKPYKLPDNRIYTLWEDAVGNVWAGTGNGLCRIDAQSGEVKVYNTLSGLADNYIAKILGDDNGHLWVSHKKGLSRLHIESESFRNYSMKEGFRGYEFLDGSGFKDPKTGQMFFGGLDGYITFFPEEMLDNPYSPQVVLTDLYISNKHVNINSEINGRKILDKPFYLTSSIELTYLDRGFSIEFAALHYSNPSGNKYAYMLEGFDNDWVETDAALRRATYTGLPAGKYLFKVKAANSDGVWNEEPAVLSVIILPPWWRTNWAFFGYIIIFCIIIGLVYYVLSVKWRMKHQIEVEHLEMERMQELQQIKTRFFTSVSHELRTPLTLILDPAERLIGSNPDSEERTRYYHLIRKNAKRLLELVNQLLAFKRIESGHEELKFTVVDVRSFFYSIFSSFELKASQQRIDFSFQSSAKVDKLLLDTDKTEKILYNLLANAFKYTQQGGLVKLALATCVKSGIEDTDKMWLEIKVTDSGSGIEKEELAKIFDFFYKTDASNGYDSSGIGLALIKEFVTLLQGEINVESTPGLGSSFTVLLPLIVPDNSDEEVSNDSTRNEQMSNADDATDGFVESLISESEDNPQLTVLVVEDNKDLRDYITGIISPLYNVIEASDGLIGYNLAVKHLPDLVVSDVVMPNMSGIEFCEKVKCDLRTCHIPVIILTSLQNQETEIVGIESGADVYLTKPFNSSLLLVHINNLTATRKKLKEQFSKLPFVKMEGNPDNSKEQQFLDEVSKIVKDHISSGAFEVQLLADKLNISRTQLYRKVKNSTGKSVFEVVNSIRMEMACELLLSGDHNVAEVADRLGYSEPGNFSRAFIKFFGKTPKDFAASQND